MNVAMAGAAAPIGLAGPMGGMGQYGALNPMFAGGACKLYFFLGSNLI